MLRLMFMLALSLGFPLSLSAAPALPFDPATLHGFNLMEKIAANGMKSVPYREEDFALIKEFGFNYVRLPVDYRCYTEANDWLSFREDVLRHFDQAIAWGEKYGIHVTLALHRAPGYCVNPPPEAEDLWTSDEALAAFTAHWEMFARRYESVPAARLSFNLVNEPSRTAPENVMRVYRHVVAAIHRVNPARVVFLDGVDGGGKTLPELASLPNVIQSGRGYFFPVSTYRASYRDVSREFMPAPSWPVQPPHHVMLAYTQSLLERCKAERIGWAMWNFRGEFGVLDSNRSDVAYEEVKDHKLDRKLMDLLVRFAAP